MGTEMPKMDGIEMNGVVYVLESDCRKGVNWALKHGRQPLFDEATTLFHDIANSDMAQREEDEGNTSPLLERVRDYLARATA